MRVNVSSMTPSLRISLHNPHMSAEHRLDTELSRTTGWRFVLPARAGTSLSYMGLLWLPQRLVYERGRRVIPRAIPARSGQKSSTHPRSTTCIKPTWTAKGSSIASLSGSRSVSSRCAIPFNTSREARLIRTDLPIFAAFTSPEPTSFLLAWSGLNRSNAQLRDIGATLV